MRGQTTRGQAQLLIQGGKAPLHRWGILQMSEIGGPLCRRDSVTAEYADHAKPAALRIQDSAAAPPRADPSSPLRRLPGRNPRASRRAIYSDAHPKPFQSRRMLPYDE